MLGDHWSTGSSKALPWREQRPDTRRGKATRRVQVKTKDCRRLLRRQQGKTRKVELGGDVLHRSGHSVNGMIDLILI